MSQTAFAVTAGLIALAMAMATFDRWLARHRPHELTWTIAFACFAIASFALALGARHGWNGPLFRTFFLFGAIINVPVLALGTLQLHDETRARYYIWTVALFCAFSAGVMVTTRFRTPLPIHELARGSVVFDPLPRVLAAVGSGVASLLIVGGAIRSIIKRHSRQLVMGNALIALGTLITGASGLLNSVMGAMDAFAVTLTLGIAVIFLGFLTATARHRSSNEAVHHRLSKKASPLSA